MLHRGVAQLLLLGTIKRWDMCTTVEFIKKGSNSQINMTWKICGFMSYLKGITSLLLILKAIKVNMIHWQVYESYAIHTNFKSHTGGSMSVVKGKVIDIPNKQNINTKVSTDFELVWADNEIPHMVWNIFFVQAQWYYPETTILHQDNGVYIRLYINRKAPSYWFQTTLYT